MTERIILVHGIWMRGFTLHPLARRLRAVGYAVETFDYPSVSGGVDPAVSRLIERLHARDGSTMHLVGHSLGALIALQAARFESAPGRIVCLGPPLRGSAVARHLRDLRGGRWLLGRSADALVGGVEPWSGARQVGVVAGSRRFGIGAAAGMLRAPHDGTVSIAETRLPGIADHCTVAVSHGGLLFSREVADRTIAFLRTGRFAPARA